MKTGELKIGDSFFVEKEFSDGFTSDVRRKMQERVAVVIRLYSVMSPYDDGEKAELEFSPPTKRHKAFKKSFSVSKIKKSISRGHLTYVGGESWGD